MKEKAENTYALQRSTVFTALSSITMAAGQVGCHNGGGGQQGEYEGGQRMQGCNHEIVGERHKSVRVAFVSHAPKTCCVSLNLTTTPSSLIITRDFK